MSFFWQQQEESSNSTHCHSKSNYLWFNNYNVCSPPSAGTKWSYLTLLYLVPSWLPHREVSVLAEGERHSYFTKEQKKKDNRCRPEKLFSTLTSYCADLDRRHKQTKTRYNLASVERQHRECVKCGFWWLVWQDSPAFHLLSIFTQDCMV